MQPIPRFPDYKITRTGKIWSTGKGRFLSPSVGKRGYLQIQLRKNKIRINKYIHTLLLETFVGQRPNGMECRHLDGNKQNNRLDNLCWGTSSENKFDVVKHEGNVGNSKLSKKDVKIIFSVYHDGLYSGKELAEIFNVHPATISYIVNRKTWKKISVC